MLQSVVSVLQPDTTEQLNDSKLCETPRQIHKEGLSAKLLAWLLQCPERQGGKCGIFIHSFFFYFLNIYMYILFIDLAVLALICIPQDL